MEMKTSKYLATPKMSRITLKQEVRSKTPVKGRLKSKKNAKKLSKRSAKTNRILISYEYEMKSRMTWEYVDAFQNIDNWHEMLKGNEDESKPVKIEALLTKIRNCHDSVKVEVNCHGSVKYEDSSKPHIETQQRMAGKIALDDVPINENSVGTRNICDDQHNENTVMVQDEPLATGGSTTTSKGSVMTHSTAPVHELSADNIQNDAFPGISLGTMKNPVKATNPKPNQKKKKRFKCSDCEKEFIWNSNLIHHMRIHSGEKPFKCKVCPKMFTYKHHLKTHQRIHTGEKPFKCTECPKMFSRNSHLKTHQLIHSGEKAFKCTECPKMFSLKCTLMRHHHTHSGVKSYKCIECSKMFSHRSALMRHHRTLHSGTMKNPCVICDDQRSKKTVMIQDEPLATGGSTTTSNDSVMTRSTAPVHDLTADNIQNDAFPGISLGTMKNPVQATNPKRPNKTKKKQLKCDVCEKEFMFNGQLIVHMRIHSGEKPFKCTECPQVFAQKGQLTTHQRIHTGKKPFKCAECPQMFSQKNNLTTHQRIHSGEKPFKCTHCPKEFSQHSHLKNHLRIHSGEKPFKCNECPQVFSRKGQLTTHQRTHSGERPFKCSECPKMFSLKCTLMSHHRTHSGEKPFKCTECSKMFAHRSTLMRHHRTLHSDVHTV